MIVLLFTQTGDERPKVAHYGNEARRVAECFARDEARNAAYPAHPDHVPPYWLVECENAEAGRACISLWKASGGLRKKFNDDVFVDAGTVEIRGRILVSGGKS